MPSTYNFIREQYQNGGRTIDLTILYDRIRILEEEKKVLQEELRITKRELRNVIVFPNKSNRQKNRRRR